MARPTSQIDAKALLSLFTKSAADDLLRRARIEHAARLAKMA